MTDRPRPAPATWPYPHRTIEQVDRDEGCHEGPPIDHLCDAFAYMMAAQRQKERERDAALSLQRFVALKEAYERWEKR